MTTTTAKRPKEKVLTRMVKAICANIVISFAPHRTTELSIFPLFPLSSGCATYTIFPHRLGELRVGLLPVMQWSNDGFARAIVIELKGDVIMMVSPGLAIVEIRINIIFFIDEQRLTMANTHDCFL